MEKADEPLLMEEGGGPLGRQSETDSDTDGVSNKGASVLQTAANLFNELEGSGLLGMPYAIMLAGWGSLVCMIAVGTMAGYTGFILAKCM